MKKSMMNSGSTRQSPIENAQLLKFGGSSPKRHKPTLALTLPLTSLIDAFSIIVIYLLIGTQGGQEAKINSKMQLPAAVAGISQEKDAPTIRIQDGEYFINDEKVHVTRLGEKLAALKLAPEQTEKEILIQADQKMNYADLDPLLKAGSEAGIQKLKFAVVPRK